MVLGLVMSYLTILNKCVQFGKRRIKLSRYYTLQTFNILQILKSHSLIKLSEIMSP